MGADARPSKAPSSSTFGNADPSLLNLERFSVACARLRADQGKTTWPRTKTNHPSWPRSRNLISRKESVRPNSRKRRGKKGRSVSDRPARIYGVGLAGDGRFAPTDGVKLRARHTILMARCSNRSTSSAACSSPRRYHVLLRSQLCRGARGPWHAAVSALGLRLIQRLVCCDH